MAVLTANPSQKSTKRYPFLDELRGAAILMMIAYHLLYDGVVFAGWDIPLFSPPLSIWQDSIGALFILLSGCMCRLSRSNWRRGLRCLAAACVITAVTFFLVPTVADWFGVLHFLGCAMLLYPVFRPLLDRFPPLPGAVACFLLFWVTYPVNRGKIGMLIWQVDLPTFLYRNFATAILGFPPYHFVSSDYYPLLPWIFLFLAGYWLGEAFLQRRVPEFCYREHLPALGWIGRHALIIYLVHQPVVYGVLWIADWLL